MHKDWLGSSISLQIKHLLPRHINVYKLMFTAVLCVGQNWKISISCSNCMQKYAASSATILHNIVNILFSIWGNLFQQTMKCCIRKWCTYSPRLFSLLPSGVAAISKHPVALVFGRVHIVIELSQWSSVDLISSKQLGNQNNLINNAESTIEKQQQKNADTNCKQAAQTERQPGR